MSKEELAVWLRNWFESKTSCYVGTLNLTDCCVDGYVNFIELAEALQKLENLK